MRRAASVARGAFRARPFGVDFPEPHAHLRPGGARWLAASPSVTRPVVDPRAPLTAGGINAVRAYTSDDDTRRMNPAVVVGASRGGLCPTCSSAVQPMWPKALLPNEVGVHGADNGPTYWCASCKDVCKDPIRRGGAHGSNDDGVTGVVDTNGGISGALHYPAMSPTARAPHEFFTRVHVARHATHRGSRRVRRRGGELAGHGDARRTGGAVRGAHHRRRRRRRIGAFILILLSCAGD